ncbi:MAG TPA: nuclear transport factor 2 family protein [Thermoanaerobaculia bacterium]|nr:nuclear transport factor 2 family protein [Thermoanaerobaculia bacterium]
MRPRPLLLALVLLVPLLAGTATLHADDFEELQRLHKELSVATWAGDAVWFEQNLSDDYVLITPAGTARTKRDVVSELATPGMKMDPFEAIEVQIRLYGDSAVINGRMLQRYTLGRVRYANDLRYTDVFVKKKGRWLLVSGHASNVAIRR